MQLLSLGTKNFLIKVHKKLLDQVNYIYIYHLDMTYGYFE